MKREVTIEAIEIDKEIENKCSYCMFRYTCDALLNFECVSRFHDQLTLPSCFDGYIYKIKEANK